MKNNDIRWFLYSSSLLLLVVLSACNKDDAPPTMYNPNASYPAGAVITSVIPASSAIAGQREITITGTFSRDPASDWIYFGGEQAAIKRMSVTADTIVVYRPVISGAVDLKATILQAVSNSQGIVPYNLESPIRPTDISGLPATATAMEANANGTSLGDTIWFASLGYITMLMPDGVTFATYKDTSYLKAKVNGKASDFVNAFSDMKFGPGGFLYATFLKSKTIYQLNPANATPVAYAAFSGSATYAFSTLFDFNSNGDLYLNPNTSATRGNGLFLAKKGTATPVAVGAADYSGGLFVGLRIYNGYIYVATAASISRSQINPADGTLNPKDPAPVVNLAADSTLTGCTINSFTIASDGTLLVTLNNSVNYSLYILQNGVLAPYYHNTSILPKNMSQQSQFNQLVWGAGRYLYMRNVTTTGATLTRVGIANNDNSPLSGAPYVGRGL